MNSDILCRICYDSDDNSDLIQPCKCSGTMKYIHRKCLNKWRLTTTSIDSMFKCDQCKFEYVTIEKKLRESKLKIFNMFLYENPVLLYFINFIYFTLVYGTLIYYDFTQLKDNHNNKIFKHNYYLSVIIYLFSLFTLFTINLLQQKQKYLYIKYFYSDKYIIFSLILGIILFQFNVAFGLVTYSFITQYYIKHHYDIYTILHANEFYEAENLDV